MQRKLLTGKLQHVITKWNCFSADTEKVLVVWIQDQATHSIPVSQSVIQSKALILDPVRAERSKEAAEENFETR